MKIITKALGSLLLLVSCFLVSHKFLNRFIFRVSAGTAEVQRGALIWRYDFDSGDQVLSLAVSAGSPSQCSPQYRRHVDGELEKTSCIGDPLRKRTDRIDALPPAISKAFRTLSHQASLYWPDVSINEFWSRAQQSLLRLLGFSLI
jgi:hypothetical protein